MVDPSRRAAQQREDYGLAPQFRQGSVCSVWGPALAQLIVDAFADDALWRWLGDGPVDDEPGFVLNTIDRAVLRPTGLLLEGQGRPSGIEVVYQDV
jgi:hypothetical protein